MPDRPRRIPPAEALRRTRRQALPLLDALEAALDVRDAYREGQRTDVLWTLCEALGTALDAYLAADPPGGLPDGLEP